MHNYASRFNTAIDLGMKLIEEFKDVVRDTLSFSVGYFEGQSHSKIWLVDRQDFSTMYKKYPKGRLVYGVMASPMRMVLAAERNAKERKDHLSVRRGKKRLTISSSS